MRGCRAKCQELLVSCPVEDCRFWINSENDLNCTLEAIDNHDYGDNKKMTLREIGKKLNISHVMVSFIESNALEKLKSKDVKNSFS